MYFQNRAKERAQCFFNCFSNTNTFMNWHIDLPYNGAICRYNEIGTKGNNRAYFVERLCDSLRNRLAGLGKIHIELEHGRVFFTLEDGATFTPEKLAVLRQVIPTISGVSSLSPGFLVEPTMEALETVLDEFFPAVRAACPATPGRATTYAMRARRSDKAFPLTCEQVERHFAERLLSRFPELEIDLKHADLVVEVEIRHQRAFVSFERIAGAGGLPSGTAGNVLTMLSGGFDSPVASYEMMRRGCHVDFLTFHSSPYTPPATLEKVAELVRQLNTYQKKGCLVACNLVAAQKAIRDNCLSKHRTVLYRRMMMRIAEAVANGLNSLAIVTGDNLGQVASQTLTNMSIISSVTQKMILRPLLTFDKLQIISVADAIGTSIISARNVPDSCTVFAPDNPTTMADLQKILEDETHLDIPALLQDCLQHTCFLNPKTFFEHPWLDRQTI